MTKAEIINRITEQYERELDIFNKCVEALKRYGVKYDKDKLSFGGNDDYGYELVCSNELEYIRISSDGKHYYLRIFDETDELVESANFV